MTAKHAAAQKTFEQFLTEIQNEKKRIETELENARKTLTTQTSENQAVQNDVTSNEKTIQKLAAEIAQLTNDINALKAKNEHEIQNLEKQRAEHEKAIVNFKNQLTKSEYDHEKLKILLKKAEHEIQYLNSEKDKHQSQNYQKRIDDFNTQVHDSEKRTLELNEELSRMNTEWKDRLLKAIRDTEETIRKNESEEHAWKIAELTKELEDKNREIETLKSRRDELERQV